MGESTPVEMHQGPNPVKHLSCVGSEDPISPWTLLLCGSIGCNLAIWYLLVTLLCSLGKCLVLLLNMKLDQIFYFV
jgi:hypothetical protein